MTTMTLVNPLKQLRIDINMSSAELAQVANIQQAAIGQAEEGFYPEPLPSLLIALGINPDSPRAKRLSEDYKAYQVEKRKLNGPLGIPKLSLSPVFSTNIHPLVSWRDQSGLATYGFCSAFCVHMPTVNRFEKHIDQLNEVPPPVITEALTQAGYDLDEFIEACQIFKVTVTNLHRIRNNLPPVGSS
jgi:DNA-binding XRE family transcriptional regulator